MTTSSRPAREAGAKGRERFVREMYAAIDRKDNDAFIANMTDDVWVRFGNAEPIVGKEANRQAFAQFFAAIKGLRHRIDHTHLDGDSVVLEFTVTYTRLDGREVTVPAASVFDMEGELIKRFQVYVDQTPLWAPA